MAVPGCCWREVGRDQEAVRRWSLSSWPCDDHVVTDLVLFDLDGTLVDHRNAVLTAIRQIVQGAENAVLPADELVELWWDLERRHMREYLAGDCSFAEQRCRRLRSFLPVLGEQVPGDPGLTAWFAERYLAAFEADPATVAVDAGWRRGISVRSARCGLVPLSLTFS
jgi:hypothetical protein